MMTYLFKRFLQDDSGNVYMLVGLYISILLGILGIGITMGNSAILKNRMQNSSDSAALAAAIKEGATAAERKQIARRYYALNFPDGYLGTDASATGIKIDIGGASGSRVRVSAEHTRDAEIYNILEPGAEATVAADSVVEASGSSGMDMVMVMDHSSSMRDLIVGSHLRKEEAACTASDVVIKEVLETTASGGSRLAWIHYATSVKSSRPFTRDAATMRANRLPYCDIRAYGATSGGEAMEAAETRIASARSTATKAVIYMTDGMNTWYRGSGPGRGGPHPAMDAPAIAACGRMKADGVVIFAVSLGLPSPPPALLACASSPDKIYNVHTLDDMSAAFRDIVIKVRNIRVTH